MRLRSLLPAVMLALSPALLHAQPLNFAFTGTNTFEETVSYSISITDFRFGIYNSAFLNFSKFEVDNGTLEADGGGFLYIQLFAIDGLNETLVGTYGSGSCVDIGVPPTACEVGAPGGSTFNFAPLFTQQIRMELDFTATAGASFDIAGVGELRNTSVVPEPSTWMLLASGMLVLGGVGMRRRQQ